MYRQLSAQPSPELRLPSSQASSSSRLPSPQFGVGGAFLLGSRPLVPPVSGLMMIPPVPGASPPAPSATRWPSSELQAKGEVTRPMTAVHRARDPREEEVAKGKTPRVEGPLSSLTWSIVLGRDNRAGEHDGPGTTPDFAPRKSPLGSTREPVYAVGLSRPMSAVLRATPLAWGKNRRSRPFSISTSTNTRAPAAKAETQWSIVRDAVPNSVWSAGR